MFLPHGLGLYWRDQDTIQLGLRERTHILPRLYPAEVDLLPLFKQPVTLIDVLEWAKRHGIDSGRARLIWDDIASSGLALEEAPDMAYTEFSAAARSGCVTDRSSTAISIHGGGLTGAILALLANGEGFGSVSIDDPQPVTPTQASWLGLHCLGTRLDVAVRARLQSAQSATSQTLHVSISSRVWPRYLAGETLARNETLVPVMVDETCLRIGPVILPGLSPCIECLEMTATEKDPAWPHLEYQASRLPILEPDPSSSFMAASWVLRELVHLTSGSTRLSHHQLIIRPGSAWPEMIPVDRHPGCGCSATPLDDGEDRGAEQVELRGTNALDSAEF